MAIFIPSAAVPWIGMLIAIRSPAERNAPLRADSSGQVPAPAEQRGDEPLVAGQDLHLDRVAADALVGREVVGDELLRLLARDLEALGKAVVAQPVRQCRS